MQAYVKCSIHLTPLMMINSIAHLILKQASSSSVCASILQRNLPYIFFCFLYICIKTPVICQCAENILTSFISFLDIVCMHLLFVLLHLHCKFWGWAAVLYVQHLLQWVQDNRCASGNAVKQNNERVCMCQMSRCHCECAAMRNIMGWVK